MATIIITALILNSIHKTIGKVHNTESGLRVAPWLSVFYGFSSGGFSIPWIRGRRTLTESTSTDLRHLRHRKPFFLSFFIFLEAARR